MKLSTCIQHINQALNFPAIGYDDISVYFDMAIAELNTTLHTSIPLVSEMIVDFKRNLSNMPNRILISAADLATEIPSYTSTPTEDVKYYFDKVTGRFGIRRHDHYEYFNTIVGYLHNAGEVVFYQATYIPESAEAAWFPVEGTEAVEAPLHEYLPDEWVLLWLIPYVCFKYSCRDGGTASTFAEELQQGFQQLQETYDIPPRVYLAKYADKYAYRGTVTALAPNLNQYVATVAIFSDMKHPRSVLKTYDDTYTTGGFGL